MRVFALRISVELFGRAVDLSEAGRIDGEGESM